MMYYLDFEGNVAGDLFLAGELVDGVFRQVVLDPRLEGLAEQHAMPVMTPEEYIKNLFDRLEAKGVSLAAYSTAEAQTLGRIAKDYSVPLPSVTYVNMARAAKAWINRHHRPDFDALPPVVLRANDYQSRRQRWSLTSIMRLTDFAAPADYAIGKTTSRINSVIQGLEKRDGDYSRLTRVQKQKATKVLKHNRFDVEALAKLQQILVTEAPHTLERGSGLLEDLVT